MIGKMIIGKSFSGCIGYCLEDKPELTEEEKLEMSLTENLQHKDRAEVLFYNNCFGTKKELASQFHDVRKLSARTEKPVLHITLRLAPGETLSKEQLTEIAQACAAEFKFDKNQYFCALHKDTREQHIHIVANRVGYDGRAVDLSNNYQRISNFCRKMEKQYGLRQVLNPHKFLSKEERLIPRFDSRKEQLKADIRATLQQVNYYHEFEHRMRSLGYQVLKGRGISFTDEKKVKIKGSEVGFSLKKIEKILELKQRMEMRPHEEKDRFKMLQDFQPKHTSSPSQKLLQETFLSTQLKELERSAYYNMQKALLDLMFPTDRQQAYQQGISAELLREAKKKKKKKHELSR
jgi:hypothetical protein